MAREWTAKDSKQLAATSARKKTEGFAGASWPETGSADAANYGYGRQGADGYAGGYSPALGSADAANYGYGREGADGYWGGYAPEPGSNDSANYGYGREGVDATYGGYAPEPQSNDAANYGYGRQGYDAHEDLPAQIEVRIFDDLAIWTGADPVLSPEVEATEKENTVSDSKSAEVRQTLNGDWMVDSSNIDVAVSGSEAVLTGSVVTEAQRNRAEHLAAEASGIASVRNNLRVDQRGFNP